MSKDACVIKGNRRGLTLYFPDDLAFAEVIRQLRTRLAAAQHFFAGATVSLTAQTRLLSAAERTQLEQAVQEFGLVLDDQAISAEDRHPPHLQAAMEGPVEPVNGEKIEAGVEPTLLLRRTLRSGQTVRFDGNVVIVGDVNPGAEIVCAGDIVVLGSLRGIAHAGCRGNQKSVVLAFSLQPTQLRIANFISRAPDDELPHPSGPEIARIDGNMIQISQY